ncbi:histone acetyltransferase type B catalytic subunit-like [Symsagittifera roscoffensis]|uniref:histone acetyltransferase type B catalytic subunit-like n=1 Tax=Symsagittifera roscoffensis TaxID=84072 RepID=UPI00307BFA83
MVQAFSGQVEAFKSEALECITFHYVHSIEDFENDRVTFKPQFAHQIFGEDETIFGYKDLAIDMYYTAGTLKCFIRVNYSGRIEESIEAKVDDDPQESLKKNFTNGIISSEFDFLKELKKDEAFKPHGMLLTQYSRYDDHKEKCFCLFKSDSTTPGFLSYHKDMQTFLTWFIDGSSFIEDDDPEWKFYTMFVFMFLFFTRAIINGVANGYLTFFHLNNLVDKISQMLHLTS